VKFAEVPIGAGSVQFIGCIMTDVKLAYGTSEQTVEQKLNFTENS
jgi:hypothetical protein